MAPFTVILTHPGSAHKDEFLACSVLLALHPVPIVRREPTAADLSDPGIAVVDVGHRHEPALNNFDHHQLPKDHPPTCSLSLVLQHLGIYADARQFCEWLEPAEWFDCRGPVSTAAFLGVDRAVLPKLNSPTDTTLLRRFALASRLEAADPLWAVMRLIGEDLLDYVRSLRARLDFIARHAEIWDLPLTDPPAQVLFLPRTEPLPDDPSLGLDRYIESRGLAAAVVGTVVPDRRNVGYGLSRFQDKPVLDFTRLAATPGVHFAHARGFVAKTTLTSPAELRTLLALAAGVAAPERPQVRLAPHREIKTNTSHPPHPMSDLPDCQYCRQDQRLHDLMIEVAPLRISTLYLFKEQTYRGRCVVAYRDHVNELFELPDAELALYMQDVKQAARAMQDAFNPAKINYGAYSDKLPHLHVHLVPKYRDGPNWGAPFVMMPEPKHLLTADGYAALIADLKAKL